MTSSNDRSFNKRFQNGTGFDGQDPELKGYVFQLASERPKEFKPDQFKETLDQIATWASKKLLKSSDEAILILRLMREEPPTPYVMPSNFKDLSKPELDIIMLERKTQEELVRSYNTDKRVIIDVVMQQCSPSMKTRLNDAKFFEECYIKKDLLKLLKRIQHLVHDDTTTLQTL